VAIVEGHVTTREGLAALIGGTSGYPCVGRFASVEALCAGRQSARRNGAVGSLLKKTPPGRPIDAIREFANSGAPMPPETPRKVVTLFRKTPVAERPFDSLTGRSCACCTCQRMTSALTPLGNAPRPA
jgi:hypothetical protein